MTSSSSAGEPDGAGAVHFALTPEQAAALFPFHIVLDREMRVLQTGASFARICPQVKTGDSFPSHFEVTRPKIALDYEAFRANTGALFILGSRHTPLRLRGQVVPLDAGHLAFIGSPWSPEAGALRALGVLLTDFALHDAMPELVNVVQAQRLAMEDLQRLTAKLRQQRQALRDTNDELQRLAAIAANTEQGVVVCSPAGDVEWVNASFLRLYGYTEEQLREKPIGELLCGPFTDMALVRNMAAAIAAGQGFRCELQNRTAAGRSIWVAVEVQSRVDSEGVVTGFMALHSDISERKDYELRTSLAYAVTRILAENTDAADAIRLTLDLLASSLGCESAVLRRSDTGTNLDLRPPSLTIPVRIARQDRGEIAFYGTPASDVSPGLLETVAGLARELEQFVERREAEQHRGELLSLLDSTLESTAEAILVTDLRGNPTRVNRRWLELWRVPDSLAGSPDRDALEAHIDAQLQNPEQRLSFRRALKKDPRQARTHTLHLLDGRAVEEYATPQTMGGAVVGRVWVSRDITESFRSRRERENLVATLNATLEATADGILVTDLDQNIVIVNQRFFDMWNVPPESRGIRRAPELRALVLDQVAGPAAFAEPILRLYRNPEESSFDVVHFRDGRVYERYSQPQRVGDRVTGRVWSYRDVTERSRTEQKLVQASRAKSDFLANISHEIRTPLNAVVGYTELLRETPLDATQSEMLTAVWAGSEQLLSLINDLLDMSKIEAGQVDIAAVDVNALALTEQVIEVLRLRAERKKLAVYLSCDPPGPPPRLRGDAHRVRQILMNLTGNAVKFTPSGWVAVHLQWTEELSGDVRLRFTVSDSGPGILPELQDRIFDQFYRAEETAVSRVGGAGLGLSISRRLCEAMGGTLGVESTPGQGSSFWFELVLPRSGPPVEAPVRPVPAFVDEAVTRRARSVLRAAGVVETGPDGARVSVSARPDGLEVHHPGRSPQTVTFPLTPSRVQRALVGPDTHDTVSAQPAAPSAAPAPVAKVLLVEDDPDSQAYASRVLRRAGHIVTCAATVADALAALQAHQFDIVLMDGTLPDGSGLDATRALRELENADGRRRTPVIAVTAHALEGYRSAALEAGVDDYLAKPVRPQVLLETVLRWSSAAAPPPAFEPDPDLLDLLPGYLSSVRSRLGEIRELAGSGRFHEAAILAHNLKGSGSSYGLPVITASGRQMEQAAKLGDATRLSELAGALEAELAHIRLPDAP